MCGRYWIEPETMGEIEKIVGDIDRKIQEQGFAGDIYPGKYAPVMEHTDAGMRLTRQKWGYPAYQKNKIIFNARSETVMEKKRFQSGIFRHRIVIPVSGFYEWNRNKEKNIFKRSGSAILYLAGFCDCFENEKRFLILTTAANASMVRVHDRMPLVLEEHQLREWMEDDHVPQEILHQTPVMLEHYAEYEQQTLF